MADTFETAARQPGGAKSTILRLIRPSARRPDASEWADIIYIGAVVSAR